MLNDLRVARAPRRFPLLLMILVVAVGFVDWATGPAIHFPLGYVVPVALAAWVGHAPGSVVAAVLLVALRASLDLGTWASNPDGVALTLLNALVRGFVLLGFAAISFKAGQATRELAERVQTLEGILPICSYCKRIRDDQQAWQSLEGYIAKRSHAEFSHGICPECMREHYPAFAEPPPS